MRTPTGRFRRLTPPLAPEPGTGDDEASSLMANGFIGPTVKELPMEYTVEMNRLAELRMEGSIG